MKKNVMEIKAYNFEFKGGVDNRYTFITDNQISYSVKFKDSSYIFDGKLPFPLKAYEMVIEIIKNPLEIRPPLDAKIPFTIATIFYNFYSLNNEQVIIYICDSSDRKQEVRMRKFNQWVEYFKGNEFVKIDNTIIESPQLIYYTSIILKSNHPHKKVIVETFTNLGDSDEK
jgi:hypothetical protein